MKKWITSNYHYMVPEYDETCALLEPNFDYFLKSLERGQLILGNDCATPVLFGPVTIARLTKTKSTDTMEVLLDQLIPLYSTLISKIVAMGFTEIQIHEPVLVFGEEDTLLPLFKRTYPAIIRTAADAKNVSINMVSYMEDVGEKNYLWLISQPEINIISLDFSTARGGHNIDFVLKHGFPSNKTLGVGIIDSRNVWKVIPSEIVPLLSTLSTKKIDNIRIQPSGSLQYCPWDFALETAADVQNHPSAGVLSFAVQKLDEIHIIAKAVVNPAVLDVHTEAWNKFTKSRKQALSKSTIVSLERLRTITDSDLTRAEPYKVRRSKQLPGLPLLPTTTIGSFPQTNEIRRLRAQWKKGTITDDEYKAGIDQQIAYCIGIQEALGLDVLVSPI
jgi:5-methyltetrahydropteroyltriglutamate--homocysteine methyltransferase